MKYFILYLIIINLISALICVADKKRSIKGKWRISENTLLLLAIIGGSIGMYSTMKKIRHKTQHKKFMVGIPIIIFLQTIIFLYYIIC